MESDFLIYTQGNLFCVEIKRYKGRLYYPPRERVGQISSPRGPLSHPPLQGFDDSIIIQEKVGNYGEGIFLIARSIPSPCNEVGCFLPPISSRSQTCMDTSPRTAASAVRSI